MATKAQVAILSYSRDDSEFALRLAKDLKAAGANVWLDQLDIEPGQQWQRAVQDALANSAVLLVILSPSSVNSTNVIDEVSFAIEERKRVIPVLYRACDVPFRLDRLQRIDFSTDYARGLKTLLNVLGEGQHAVAGVGAAPSQEGQVQPTAAQQARKSSVGWLRAFIEKRRKKQEAVRAAKLAARGEEERKRAAEQARLEMEPGQAPAPAPSAPATSAPVSAPPAPPKKLKPKPAAEKKKAAPPVREEEEFNVEFPHERAQQAMFRLSQVEVPSEVPIDNVHFTLTGPVVLAPGTAHELQFWVHVEQQRSAVLQAASVLQRVPQSEMAVKSEGPYPLQRGSRISVGLKIAGLKCLDNHKWITWTGEIGNTTFVIEVPGGTSEGAYPGRASIRLNGCEIARMSFLVRVGTANLKLDEIPSQTTSYRSAFASYASEDRVEVLGRVQGMEAAYKGLAVFVDVIDLRSGQDWEREVVDRISKADVFYLFWCRHAMHSDWVEKEWRRALAAKGEDFIDPVPLERPELAPPPKELAAKHFNDPLLAFIAAAGGAHSD